MIELSLGCNFTEEHVDVICDLVQLQRSINSTNRITSVYGSPGILNPFGSVRPRRREIDIDSSTYSKSLRRLRTCGVQVMWTMNSLIPTHRAKIDTLQNVATWLSDSYSQYGLFDKLIVSHPGLIDALHANMPIDLVISTIMNVHSVAQVKEIKNRWPNVIAICPALWRNRDLDWLKRANRIIPLELLANEFCSIGGVECEGLYRQACYLSQSLDATWNPMDICRSSRERNPESWLKAKFILPDWMDKYREETGIKSFKITGRTHPAGFIRYIGERYIRGVACGNLLALWGMLEATYANANQNAVQQETLIYRYPNIPVEEVAKADYFLSPACSSETCSDSCNHCLRLYNRIMGISK